MRYNLRTLVIATAIAPPMMALFWFYGFEIIAIFALVVGMLIGVVTALAVCLAPVALFGYGLSLVARLILYVGRSPENRT